MGLEVGHGPEEERAEILDRHGAALAFEGVVAVRAESVEDCVDGGRGDVSMERQLGGDAIEHGDRLVSAEGRESAEIRSRHHQHEQLEPGLPGSSCSC
jgi:hypothetical protein